MRVVGTCCEVGGYFTQLHVNTTLGVLIFMVAQILFLPYFIKTKAYDYVALWPLFLGQSSSRAVHITLDMRR